MLFVVWALGVILLVQSFRLYDRGKTPQAVTILVFAIFCMTTGLVMALT